MARIRPASFEVVDPGDWKREAGALAALFSRNDGSDADSRATLRALLAEPEGKTLEFKRDLSSLQPVLKTLTAFANTAGGTLIVGRANDGRLQGLADPASAEERLANAVADGGIGPR